MATSDFYNMDMEEEAEFLRLINETSMLDFDDGKNYDAVRTMIAVAGSNYHEGMAESEFDYYLHNLQRVDPLQTFEDDWYDHLFIDAGFMLIRNNIKCEAILHYIIDHKNVKSFERHIVYPCYESIAFKLIERGANIHYVEPDGFNLLLNSGLEGFTNVMKYLLKENIDVNHVNYLSLNALHCACCSGELGVIEILLQTDIDLYVRDNTGQTPIALAITSEWFDAASLILRSKLAENLTFDLAHELFYCLCTRNPETVDLIKLDLFLLLWEKILKSFSSSIQPNSRKQAILSIYLNNTVYRSEKWFTALKVILTSTIAAKLLEEFAAFEGESIFAKLMDKFDQVGVERQNRIELIKLLLHLGVKPSLNDLAKTLLYFKRAEEFDVLSLALPDGCLANGDVDEENQMQYVASVLCGLRDQLDFKKLENFDKNFYNYLMEYFTPTLNDALEDVIMIPNVMSLKELSRNATRKLIVKHPKILSPKHFTDFVNSLPIPIMHKNFLKLKIPLNQF